MKISEKYKVNGNVNNQQVSGEVTIYPNNFTNVPKKSIIAGFRTSLKELKRKFGTISLYDKERTKKAASLILAGTITLTSLTGCTFCKKTVAEIPTPSDTETVVAVKEETKRISYTVELGDSLWSIARKYCDSDGEIVNEIKNICKLNNLKENSILPADTILKLDVPESKLINFGIVNEDDKAIAEDTQRIEYTLRRGDNLWYIVRSYKLTKTEIANEIKHICEINGISDPDKLEEGTTIKLDVPISKLSEFGIKAEQKEEAPSVKEKTEYELLDDEWESKSQFIYDSWNNAKDSVHPDNLMFQRDYKRMFESDTNEYDGGIFHKAYGEREKLKEMLEIEGLYKEESIENQINKINDLYNLQFELTEVNLGSNYNMDSYTKGM